MCEDFTKAERDVALGGVRVVDSGAGDRMIHLEETGEIEDV